MKKNVMIIGAGGVAHVAAHKAAMNNVLLGDICIASRTQAKCDAIIESVIRKGQPAGIALDKLDAVAGERGSQRAGALQLPCVQIQAGQLHAGMLFVDMGDRAAESAADVQNS